MNDKPYTNREIDLLLQSIKQHIDDTVATPLSRIEAQTTKTNGRVTRLENWKSYIAGGLALLTIIGLPLLWMLVTDVRATKADIATRMSNGKI